MCGMVHSLMISKCYHLGVEVTFFYILKTLCEIFIIFTCLGGDWPDTNTLISVLIEQLVDAIEAASDHLSVAERYMDACAACNSALRHKLVIL